MQVSQQKVQKAMPGWLTPLGTGGVGQAGRDHGSPPPRSWQDGGCSQALPGPWREHLPPQTHHDMITAEWLPLHRSASAAGAQVSGPLVITDAIAGPRTVAAEEGQQEGYHPASIWLSGFTVPGGRALIYSTWRSRVTRRRDPCYYAKQETPELRPSGARLCDRY
ncbi:unnamed protein product [Lota lota]